MSCLSEAPSGKDSKSLLEFIKRVIPEIVLGKFIEMNTIQNTVQKYLQKVYEEQTEMKESEIFFRTITFNEKIISDILTPRTKVVAIEVNQSIKEMKEIFFTERYSRIPVYEQNIDHIIGIVSEREFFIELLNEDKVDLRKIIRKPIFVMNSMKISYVLTLLQNENAHLAIVIDEFGGTSGIVTLEDILEELVGDIRDEFDECENELIQLNETEYLCLASISLSNFFQFMKCKQPKSRYLTLGGWLFEGFKNVPKKGDSIQYKNLVFTVNEIINRRIQSITVKILNQNLKGKLGS